MTDLIKYYARDIVLDAPRVTSREIRSFSLTCVKWADEVADASNRQIIAATANGWLKIAREIDRQVVNGREAFDDLRGKLD